MGRFGEGLGGLLDDLRRFWGVLGVSWRRLRKVFSTGWSPEGPRERFGTILASFLIDFRGHQAKFSMDFVGFFGAAVNDKLKPGTDRTQDVN